MTTEVKICVECKKREVTMAVGRKCNICYNKRCCITRHFKKSQKGANPVTKCSVCNNDTYPINMASWACHEYAPCCIACNKGFGLIQYNTETLYNMIEYLGMPENFYEDLETSVASRTDFSSHRLGDPCRFCSVILTEESMYMYVSRNQTKTHCKACDNLKRKERKANYKNASLGPVCQCCSNTRVLVIDHDHATGIVRGTLCKECNVSIGYFEDNPILIAHALNFLESNGPKA